MDIDRRTLLKYGGFTGLGLLIPAPHFALSTAADSSPKSIPSPWQELNDLTGGWSRGHTYLIGGVPGMGKTTFLIECAASAVRHGFHVAYFSLEISSAQLSEKLLKAGAAIERIKIFADTAPSDEDIVRSCRNLHRCNRLDFIAVDYLQLLAANGCRHSSKRGSQLGGRNSPYAKLQIRQQVANLLSLAQEIDVPLLLAGQVRSSINRRFDKRPMIGDIAAVENLEDLVDQVIYLYRDSYYNPMTPRHDDIEVLVQKNALGPTGVVGLKFRAQDIRILSGNGAV